MIVTQTLLDSIVERAIAFHAKKVILFGSALESPQTARDIDIACDIPGMDIFLFAGVVEEELRIPIDVIPLTPANAFVDFITEHGKVLYDAKSAS